MIEERFNKRFPEKDRHFCSCYEGDLEDFYPKGKKMVIDFVKQEIQDERKRLIEDIKEWSNENECIPSGDNGYISIEDLNNYLNKLN